MAHGTVIAYRTFYGDAVNDYERLSDSVNLFVHTLGKVKKMELAHNV